MEINARAHLLDYDRRGIWVKCITKEKEDLCAARHRANYPGALKKVINEYIFV